ncbi:MAG: hypothetical protein ACXVRU_14600 [Gaiellaceae bacterium]
MLGFGIVAVFVSISHANIIWSVAGLAIFGAYRSLISTVCAAPARRAVPIASSIFLDVLNVFLFFLALFGGRDSGLPRGAVVEHADRDDAPSFLPARSESAQEAVPPSPMPRHSRAGSLANSKEAALPIEQAAHSPDITGDTKGREGVA